MNKVILVGRLTKDPEVRYTPTGKVVASFTLAVNRGFTTKDNAQEADFIPIVVWGNSAEFCGNNLNKGSKVLVDGRLQVRSYDAKDGSKRYVTEVVANYLEALERPKTQSTTNGTSSAEATPESFGADVTDEDVPF